MERGEWNLNLLAPEDINAVRGYERITMKKYIRVIPADNRAGIDGWHAGITNT